MTRVQLDDPDPDGLGLLEGLATPLLLVDPAGSAIWLNGAARALIGDGGPVSVALPAGAAEPRVTLRRGAAALEVDIRLSPAGTAGGVPLVLVEVMPDTPARQEVLRLTEQLVALSYAYPDMRFELARDGTILDFAAASPAELNVPAERFLNSRVQDVLPEPAGGLVGAALDRLNQGEEVAGVDFALPGPDGSPDGERCFEARLVALLDGARVLCSVRNVTGKAQAERQALRAHELLVDAIESIADGFVLYDADDRLVLCNAKYRELYALSEDLIRPGTSFETILVEGARRGQYAVPSDELDAWLAERIARHRAPGPPFQQRMADGRWLRVEERRTRDGGTVGLRSDVSDLKQQEAELRAARDEAERANQRKSDYVHHLSHELRTPLNAVMGFAQLIGDELMGPLGNPRYRDHARQIAAAGEYMLDMITRLLDLAKIEAGRMELREEPCDLGLITDMTFAMMQAPAGARGVALLCAVPEDTPPVQGDLSMLRQMLTNLVSNAVKFSKEGGRVVVGAARLDDGSVALSVADTGIGMSAEQLPRALDAFGQVHERAVSAERGSGLGLPLTRALIELHGGRFEIDSAPGVGTTVRLVFPAGRVLPPP
ncbi:PAS domain-containing sensor histidine kinase [Azospirillum sp.]|uniref:PAS domain-containing sensor histidine kinase n=1 Tax=Azospirillum sp. TaxID=34012 RepID=UPI003D755D08